MISGMADSVFENMLLIQVMDQSGQVIGTGGASIHSDAGQRGPFDGKVTFTPPAQAEPGRIVISDSSARDGHITHLASVEVTLLPVGGAATLITGSEQPAALWIQVPTANAAIQGGVVHISGFGGPAFEQTLNMSVLNESGQVIANTPVTLQAEAGQAGAFAVDLPYQVANTQAGVIQISVASPRDGGLTHVASVDVTLKP